MLDICQNQSLSDLVKRRKRLHEVEARFYIFQLVKAMEYVQCYDLLNPRLAISLSAVFAASRMAVISSLAPSRIATLSAATPLAAAQRAEKPEGMRPR